ncbi:DUF4411 family protein [Propionibacterium freudenreichii]|uniref:DUF4411 family protein n=1 Tax=Propionibacterium freudenreichii TaxID=1744 RepID=UPI0005A5C3BF|nr:DUF4411 family protein [Propionibacterium freudenreichii]MCT2977162.1 DUF4411 family protein [Propionibacterium freudenreichii]MCT2991346.1 DUF4411 family protein [Propionibacterium freudenreichii]MCT2993119.1 DUF4411 family protein [Propionibacterium freudenreichii]MDK9302176.1 DUF4411 family protein [Propionibacterium freudenreichii]MDK9322503.1 DUF4411 family protein [Propionibacterium freudenreichii]
MFLLDSNVFIDAKNRYYSFDVVPGFWEWLDQAFLGSVLCSIDAVREELLAGSDELSDWARTRKAFFREIDQPTVRHFAVLSEWARGQNYQQAALDEFATDRADFLLIAFARQYHFTVVTLEKSNSRKRNRVMIPDACKAMGVPVCDPFQMLAESMVRLDLRSQAT